MSEGNDAPLYRTEVRFNSIYVLESLRLGDTKTGEDLYDTVIFPGKIQQDDMYTAFVRVPTKEILIERLILIAQAAERAKHRPIIHIEAHGGADGIELTSGEYVTWRELIPILTRINIACKNNLVVVAISCHGWGLTASLMPSDRAPVMMLIGPPETMTGAALLEATRRFYARLMEELDLNRALETMNGNRPFTEWEIRPATAEILFCRVFRQYIEEYGSPEAQHARVNSLVDNIVAGRNAGELHKVALRIALRLRLGDHRAEYERLRRTFLMLDLFPADHDRFGLTYELCVNRPATARAELTVDRNNAARPSDHEL